MLATLVRMPSRVQRTTDMPRRDRPPEPSARHKAALPLEALDVLAAYFAAAVYPRAPLPTKASDSPQVPVSELVKMFRDVWHV